MDIFLPFKSSPHEEWIRIPFPCPAYLTLRAAGDMRRDSPARERIYGSLGVDPRGAHLVAQVHSRSVVVVPADGGRRTAIGEYLSPNADGMITNDHEAVLAITVADCMPIYVVDEASGARGLLHSGWRGTGILRSAIDIFQDRFGSKTKNLVVTMGPCVSAESYEVDESRAKNYEADWGAGAVRNINGRFYLDLRAANQEICRRSGVDLISVVNHCTVQDSRLGSFRRQGPDRYTLMLALLGGIER